MKYRSTLRVVVLGIIAAVAMVAAKKSKEEESKRADNLDEEEL